MAAGAQTGSEYIKHHLTNLTFGKDPTDGVWKFAHSAQEAKEMGFMQYMLTLWDGQLA